MSEMDKFWAQELQRRIGIYDEIEAKGAWSGRLTATDYLAILALAVGLVAGFWSWGALLHKSSDSRSFPFPGRTYPLASVMGVPSAVKPFRTATRTWTSAT